jgi:hypothetical protein
VGGEPGALSRGTAGEEEDVDKDTREEKRVFMRFSARIMQPQIEWHFDLSLHFGPPSERD